jgi:hypothetical protein
VLPCSTGVCLLGLRKADRHYIKTDSVSAQIRIGYLQNTGSKLGSANPVLIVKKMNVKIRGVKEHEGKWERLDYYGVKKHEENWKISN